MHEAIAVFVVAVTLAGVGARFAARLRSDLLQLRFWRALAAAAGLTSAASLLVSATRAAGTGVTTSYGWPKPFYFRFLSETGDRGDGVSFIYFVGNSLAIGGALLIAWAGWRIIRR
jgi:hypothetical protein